MSEQEYLVKRCIPLLLVNQLKACIRSFNEVTGSHLRVSGSKGELIQRIQQFTEEKYSQGDGSDCAPVQQIILAHFGSTLPIFEGSSPIIDSTLNKVIIPRPACEGRIFNNKAGYSDRELSIKSTPKRGIIEDSEFIFKPSPFYEAIELLSEIKVCPVLPEKASLVRLDFQLKKHHVANLQHQSLGSRDVGIKLFACAYDRSGQTLNENLQVLMEFPPLCEVRINTAVLQTSLRGLKNKPGTVNPPEITDLCHIDSTSFNRIEFMYANTSKVYFSQ
ncbi:E3 SUMO-protein ligase pli1, variant 2 [Basidiobolus ranarum]|uniref:E3 SUMO-protein ligase pli1, variant 2 n=1 Tax=Basidiobolus ranarum TaxID=34480 RepID=A0ABR2VNC6_9FUNG